MDTEGWRRLVIKRRQQAFGIAGLTWSMQCSFARLGRDRRLSKDDEYKLQTSEAPIDVAAIHLMLNRLAPARPFSHSL